MADHDSQKHQEIIQPSLKDLFLPVFSFTETKFNGLKEVSVPPELPQATLNLANTKTDRDTVFNPKKSQENGNGVDKNGNMNDLSGDNNNEPDVEGNFDDSFNNNDIINVNRLLSQYKP